jgi:hypothetical protein
MRRFIKVPQAADGGAGNCRSRTQFLSAALADLSKLMEEELAVLTKNADKWSYLKKMLPRMHQAKGL